MGKQNQYDHSARVPLILSGPGVPRGQRRAAHCYLYDLFPTLCELTGVDVPGTVEGQSLVPLLHDPAARVRDVLLCAYRGVQRSPRNERHKLIEYVVEGRRTTQLFDLAADPWEPTNLAGEPAHADHLERLRRELERWRTELGDDRADQGRVFWRGAGASS
jgi:arylsulfatase A-like enzyme